MNEWKYTLMSLLAVPTLAVGFANHPAQPVASAPNYEQVLKLPVADFKKPEPVALKVQPKPQVKVVVPETTSEMTVKNIIALTNASRIEQGLTPLSENTLLDRIAKAKADDMVARQYYAHADPDGKMTFAFLKAAGYSYRAAGENLAVSYTDAKVMEGAWLASTTHRSNILRPNYNETGIGIARGSFKGYPGILYIVQLFGNPIKK